MFVLGFPFLKMDLILFWLYRRKRVIVSGIEQSCKVAQDNAGPLAVTDNIQCFLHALTDPVRLARRGIRD